MNNARIPTNILTFAFGGLVKFQQYQNASYYMMKKFVRLSVLTLLFFGLQAKAQQSYSLLLNNKTLELPENKGKLKLSCKEIKKESFEEVLHVYLQFYVLPGDNEKKEMESQGVKFLSYIPNNTYICAISKKAIKNINTKGIRSMSLIPSDNKINPILTGAELPAWALKPEKQIDLLVSYYNDLSLESVKGALLKNKYFIISESEAMHHLQIRVKTDAIAKVAALNFISYVDPERAPAIPENEIERTNHRSYAIDNNLTGSNGYHYDGSGVSVAVGDDGVVGPHIDYTGRFNQTWVGTTNNGDHGDHVSGILAGAGNLNPKTKGMAPGCSLLVYMPYDNINNLPAHYGSYKVRITSLSYGQGCNQGYSSDANKIDAMMNNYPFAMSVFSAGNSGTSNCNYKNTAITGWGNITGGMKAGKNVIAVGNLQYTDSVDASSSRGPASDGRIKPDISSVGTNVYSTVSTNTYTSLTGTSMACPAISGVLAQLYQAYRVLNNGDDPTGALMKGILMNSADDIGNPGPDYKYGYGRVNALKALRILENKNYKEFSVSNNDSISTTINIPTDVKRVKIMMYYADEEATSGASKAIVNDLNMSVKDANGIEYLPWVLNPNPTVAALSAPAIRKVDSLNNMEQVTIESPAAGSTTIKVKGFQVPFGPQKFYLIYEFTYDSIQLAYPLGNDRWTPGVAETIRWDSWNTTSPVTIQTSTNNSTWTTVTSSINGKNRLYSYTPVAVTGGKLWVKIKQGNSESVTSQPINVTPIPANLKLDWICSGACRISWTAVPNASGYTVYQLGSKYMDSVATTTKNYYVFTGVDSTKDDWYSVKTLMNNNEVAGERANAIKKTKAIKLNCNNVITGNFTASRNNICTNDTISFNPISTPDTGLTYLWTFIGGTPATSTLARPVVRYNNPGTYSVSLSLSNAVSGLLITKNNLVTINGTSINAGSDQSICLGDSVTLTGTGGATLVWSYNKAIISNTAVAKVAPTETSTYLLTSTSTQGCVSYDSVLVTVLPLPTKPDISKTVTTFSTTAVANNYLWYKNGLAIGGTNQQNFTPTGNGFYKVRVGNSQGCYTFSDEMFFAPAGLNNTITKENITLFPNPNNGSFMLSGISENQEIHIFTMLGQDITNTFTRKQESGLQASFQHTGLNEGVYLISIEGKEGRRVMRFVIN